MPGRQSLLMLAGAFFFFLFIYAAVFLACLNG